MCRGLTSRGVGVGSLSTACNCAKNKAAKALGERRVNVQRMRSLMGSAAFDGARTRK